MKSKKILIIEDNFQTQNILGKKLKKKGVEIFNASLGQQGIETAKSLRPNLIILDILLDGEITGVTVLEEIKKTDSLKETPIIILTNLDNQKEYAEKLGANEYLIKANTPLKEVMNKADYYLRDK